VSVSPLMDATGNVLGGMCVVEDKTANKIIEEELFKAQKLESLGVLAGGIAHDFNNILTVIMGNVSLLSSKETLDSETTNSLKEVGNYTRRARDLTQQLLTFAKGGMPVKETASVSEMLKESVKFILRGSNVKCRFNIAKNLWSAGIDVGQINQVINNITINARQAMPNGGTVIIKAENTIIEGQQSAVPLNKGKYIKITMQDQGTGISKDNLRNIFDPYFTTKKKGHGLGLATSYSIIKNHGGHIEVESELEKGTKFHIYLPATGENIPISNKSRLKSVKSGKKILVMDDEEDVKSILGRMLKKLGYEVGFAKNATEALKLYKKAKIADDKFDLVLLDLTIPGEIGGKEALNLLFSIDPKVKAIASSGYSNDPIMSNYESYGFKGIIKKPFDLQELSNAINKAIV